MFQLTLRHPTPTHPPTPTPPPPATPTATPLPPPFPHHACPSPTPTPPHPHPTPLHHYPTPHTTIHLQPFPHLPPPYMGQTFPHQVWFILTCPNRALPLPLLPPFPTILRSLSLLFCNCERRVVFKLCADRDYPQTPLQHLARTAAWPGVVDSCLCPHPFP